MLDKAFNSEFKEGRTQKYELEDTNPDTFRVLVQWLYSQKLTSIHHEDDTEDRSHYVNCRKVVTSQIELWVLAEKLFIPQLQNEVMTCLRHVSITCTWPFELLLNHIYQNKSEKSPLHRFVVDLIAWGGLWTNYQDFPH